MKHLIMGTAGHVDHGKTALVKAITQKDCDTHREEKERGITIHLGFAHMTLADSSTIGIIDVPGHKDFIHTMVSGATGIDFVLLVVAADSGVMPQTREHLRIMEILGVKKGIVVLTKTDLVDEELLDMCESDVRDLLLGTFLLDAPLARVSAKTGAGVEKLIQLISETAGTVENRSKEGVFRMYLDRIFTVSGFGTVVTGTVNSGRLAIEDDVFLLSGKPKELRIRKMERYGEEVTEICAGDRASLNLTGLDKAGFKRGMLLSDRILRPTNMIDAALTVYEEKSAMKIWTNVILHTGTVETQARVHLIDCNRLASGETGLVQIHLDKPCFLQYGDRFVIRNSSCDTTLGGGEIIDAAPLHHRRRPEKLVNEMKSIAKGKLSELVSMEIRKFHRPVSAEDIAHNLNIAVSKITELFDEKCPKGIARYDSKKGPVFVSILCQEKIRKGILNSIRDFRKRNPLSDKGIGLDEMRSSLKFLKDQGIDDVIMAITSVLIKKGKIIEKDKTWMLSDDIGSIDKKTEKRISIIEDYLKSCAMKTPLVNQIKALCEKNSIGDREMKQILHHLTVTGRVYRIENNYIHSSIVDQCRKALISELKKRDSGITVKEFRDLVQGNRKICLLMLAQFDQEGTTVRDGDYRTLKQ